MTTQASALRMAIGRLSMRNLVLRWSSPSHLTVAAPHPSGDDHLYVTVPTRPSLVVQEAAVHVYLSTTVWGVGLRQSLETHRLSWPRNVSVAACLTSSLLAGHRTYTPPNCFWLTAGAAAFSPGGDLHRRRRGGRTSAPLPPPLPPLLPPRREYPAPGRATRRTRPACCTRPRAC